LWWDGSDLPNDEYTVQVRAEANGLSAEQQVSLRKVVPCYFSVLPANNSISMGQADSVTVIAMDHNGDEMVLDGNKLVTLIDWTGGGSFIVGPDTLQGQATVTYDKARNGSVKYFILDTLDLIDEKYHEIAVYRTDYPERNGYGYIDVMPACPVVSLSKQKISPGDKATVSIKAQTEQGTFSYPAGQMFIVSMDADARYGTLHCAGSSGTSISGTRPFKFIAADSIDVDSVVVHISASPVSGATYSIMNGQKDTLQGPTGLMSMKQIHPPGKKPGLNIEGTKNILVSPQETMTEKLTEQNSVISQKVTKKQALMNAITEAIKTRAAGKSDAVSAKQLNAMVQDLAEGDQCTRSATVTIKKETQFTGFSQNDPKWSGKPYNSINATIGDVGCALCNMASILKLLGYDVTPLTLNNWMVNNHGKNYDYYYKDGGVNWQAVTDYASDKIISDPIKDEAGQLHPNNIGKLIGTPITLDIIDTYLNNDYYIVAEVKNIHDDGSERMHFVRLKSKGNGTYNICDPGYSNRTTLSSYNNQIYKAIYYIVYK
jgi:hypothetical protein